MTSRNEDGSSNEEGSRRPPRHDRGQADHVGAAPSLPADAHADLEQARRLAAGVEAESAAVDQQLGRVELGGLELAPAAQAEAVRLGAASPAKCDGSWALSQRMRANADVASRGLPVSA